MYKLKQQAILFCQLARFFFHKYFYNFGFAISKRYVACQITATKGNICTNTRIYTHTNTLREH